MNYIYNLYLKSPADGGIKSSFAIWPVTIQYNIPVFFTDSFLVKLFSLWNIKVLYLYLNIAENSSSSCSILMALYYFIELHTVISIPITYIWPNVCFYHIINTNSNKIFCICLNFEQFSSFRLEYFNTKATQYFINSVILKLN